MAEPTLYLFDGFNVLHAGSFADVRELRDQLASYVAMRGARGIVVFDGSGADEPFGPLTVRYASHADALLERLAAEFRDTERVCLVSSDFAVRGTSGQDVMKRTSRAFVEELTPPTHDEARRTTVSDRVDDATRARLEQMRRGSP